MSGSTIMGRVSDAMADCFHGELLEAEGLGAFELLAAANARAIGAVALRKCLERFDADLRANTPAKWSAHERSPRTLITLLGAVTFTGTVFLDGFGRRRIWADELLGIRLRSRLSACAFLWVASRSAELSYRSKPLPENAAIPLAYRS